MIQFFIDLASFVAVVATLFGSMYLATLIYEFLFAYHWDNYIVPFYEKHENSIKKLRNIAFWSCLIGLLVLFASVKCGAQEREEVKEPLTRWELREQRKDSIKTAKKLAEYREKDRKYEEKKDEDWRARGKDPRIERAKKDSVSRYWANKKEWIQREEYIAKKKAEEKVKLLGMDEETFKIYEDSIVNFRFKRLEDWKKNSPQAEAYRIKKDSTSKYWIDVKEQNRIMREANNEAYQKDKAERDSIKAEKQKAYEEKQRDYKRMKEAYEEAKATENAKWDKINKEKAAKKQKYQEKNNDNNEELDRYKGRNKYLSDEDYEKEKAAKKRN